MPVIEDFESQSLDAYNVSSGGRDKWTFDSSVVYQGLYSAGTGVGSFQNIISPEGGTATAALNYYPTRGDTFRWYFRAADLLSGGRLQFFVQGDGTNRNNVYATRVNTRDNIIKITRRVNGTDANLSPVINPSPALQANVWYESIIDTYETAPNDPAGAGHTRIDLTVNAIDDATGARTEIVDTTGVDTVANFTSGGVGWGLWGDAGGSRRVDLAETTASPRITFTMNAAASGSGAGTLARDRPLTSAPSAAGELDVDAQGPINEWHLLDDFGEATALDPYTGQKASFALDPADPVIIGTNVLESRGDDVGITNTEWTLRYGSRYRFWMNPSGNFSGLYIGSTQGGLSTGEMEGVGVGADPTFGSLDIVNISTGLWDYDRYTRAPISPGSWYQFEAIVEDPSVAGSQIRLRLLDDKGQTVVAEVTRPTTGFSGVAEPVIGIAADTTGARYDKLETDDLTTFPGHWITIHGSASGSASVNTERERAVTSSPAASGTGSAAVTKGRDVGIAGEGSGRGKVRILRGTARALIFGASASGIGSAGLTKTTTRSFAGTGAATATIPLDKPRATTYAGTGTGTGTIATARNRRASLTASASGSVTAPLDRAVTFALAGSGKGIAAGWLLRGASANVISTRTVIGEAIYRTPTQIGQFTKSSPRLSGTVVGSSPQLKGTAVEETPQLAGKAVREHPTIVGTLIRD